MKTTEEGDEGGKKINGCRRHCWVDTKGFLVSVLVHAADSLDTAGAEWLLSAHYHRFPRAGPERWLMQHASIQLSMSEKPPEQKGCTAF